jgi:hypothetical protein
LAGCLYTNIKIILNYLYKKWFETKKYFYPKYFSIKQQLNINDVFIILGDFSRAPLDG